jgi:hypothetical protein
MPLAATLFKIQSIAPGGYRSRKRLSLLPQYLSRDPGRGVNMEPPEVASPEAFRKVEKFLVVTVSVAAAAIASDALVKKSLRLSSVDAFSALSAMVAS